MGIVGIFKGWGILKKWITDARYDTKDYSGWF
jgi:hypothetical protein